MSTETKKTLITIDVQIKALIITRENDYLITKANTFMVKQNDGSFTTHYVDRYVSDGKVYLLERIDRLKNVVVYREAGA